MTRIHLHLATLTGALALLVALSAPAPAAVPRKQPLTRYTELWTKSPFTVPPVVPLDEKVEENPLDDYTLAGVCKLKDGWFVVLINKKQREERVRIKPNDKNDKGFKVVNVQNGTKYMETKVQIQTGGGQKGWVEYDKKFMVLKKAAPRAPKGKPGAKPGAKPRPGQPAVKRPPMPQPRTNSRGATPKKSGRPPRVRRVPTPPTR